MVICLIFQLDFINFALKKDIFIRWLDFPS